MKPSSYHLVFLAIALLGAAVLICGCTEVSEATAGEAIHVTAICEVLVIDKDGNPVSGVPVSFTSMKSTGTAVKEGSEFSFQRPTEANGKTSFTVGYNIHQQNIGLPVPELISMSASIPGDITGSAIIDYQEANAQAGGTGAAVITKTITLQIPYSVK